jgi:SAM-dependent methyltransferase
MRRNASKKTIRDFGNQWLRHGEIADSYWTSDALFRDHFPESCFILDEISGHKVVDVGSGSGRIIKMLSRYKPAELIAVEPSNGVELLKTNTATIPNLTILNSRSEDFFVAGGADLIFSLGVIHHIPNPEAAVKNIYNNLKNGGRFVMWVYGYENHTGYVHLQKLLRPILRILPDRILEKVSFLLTFIIDYYFCFSKRLFRSRLPLTPYIDKLFSKCPRKEKMYIVFDQLNPRWAHYYKQSEVQGLLEEAGFRIELLYHRNQYSWTAIGIKSRDFIPR